jgi:hypothetical protein
MPLENVTEFHIPSWAIYSFELCSDAAFRAP